MSSKLNPQRDMLSNETSLESISQINQFILKRSKKITTIIYLCNYVAFIFLKLKLKLKTNKIPFISLY